MDPEADHHVSKSAPGHYHGSDGSSTNLDI